jgi:hypothetical protein
MAFATDAAVNKVVAMLEGVPGMQNVWKGAPESFDTQVSAWVGVGPQAEVEVGAGLVGHDVRIYVELSYAVAGQEDDAEATLASLVDGFKRRFYADRNLTGTWEGGRIELDIEGRPAYETRGGVEGRVFPLFVVGFQHEPHPAQV